MHTMHTKQDTDKATGFSPSKVNANGAEFLANDAHYQIFVGGRNRWRQL